jgi:tRNA-specific 2-thiouridylase
MHQPYYVDPATQTRRLRRAADANKDQTYFLFELRQEQLAGLRFPLGELTKAEVRERARALGLATAEKAESQEICFIPDGDTAAAVAKLRPEALPGEGEIVDGAGRTLGRHAGIQHFTVGQRRGLGVATGERLYVTGLDAQRNRVRVGPLAALAVAGARLERVNWISGEPPREAVRVSVRVRHRHEGAFAWVTPQPQGGALVRFESPVSAVTPGQAAVFDAGDVVLGGGWIAESLP